MNKVHKVTRILPTRKNAESILSLTASDLQRDGVSSRTIREIADPLDAALVSEQRKKLLLHSARYLGVVAGRQVLGGGLLAVQKVNEWRTADELPYAEADERDELEAALEQNEHHLPGRPLGIFALSVIDTVDTSAQRAYARALVHSALRKAGDREMRVGLSKNDPLTPMLVERYGFQPSGRQGSPIPGLELEQYIRPTNTKLE